MERRRFLQMVTAAAVGGAVGTMPAWAGAVGAGPRSAARGVRRRPQSGDLPGIVLVQNPWTAVGVERRGRQDPHRGEPRQHGGDHGDRREHDVRRSCRRRPRRLPRGLAVGRHGRRAGVPRRGQCRSRRPARRRRADRLVRAAVRPGAVPGDGDVGGLPRSRDRQPVRQRRDRRPRSLSRHRPELFAVRRGDHREPRAAAPGRLLRLGSSHGGGPRFGRRRRGADPDVLVGADRRSREVRPRPRRAARVHRRVLRRPGRDRLRLPGRTCSSRSPAPTSPRRTRR